MAEQPNTVKTYTIFEIAELWDEPPQRISYVVRKLRIKPVQRVGLIRLYNEQQTLQIKAGCYNLQIKGEPHGR